MEWDKLSMPERAEYIRLGVQNGITNLDHIRSVYNSYAEGGYKENTVYRGKDGKRFIVLEGKKVAVTEEGGTYITSDGRRFRPVSQKDKNRNITNEQVVDSYLKNVVYTMENPTKKGLRNGRWFMYTDVDKDNKVHKNFGPGIESNSDVGQNLKYNNSSSYSSEELNALLRPDLLDKMNGISADLHEMYGEDVDTMSLGNRLILLDIAHNVRPRGSKRKNMPKAWPSLIDAMVTGNSAKAKNEMNSGSERRRAMREQLLWNNSIDSNTVQNK